jgi:enoyl-CoA hydratase/carnithine racemase
MVVPHSMLLSAAIDLAQQINQNSPDSVQSTKKALILSQSHSYEGTVQSHALSLESKRVYNGSNIKVSRASVATTGSTKCGTNFRKV